MSLAQGHPRGPRREPRADRGFPAGNIRQRHRKLPACRVGRAGDAHRALRTGHTKAYGETYDLMLVLMDVKFKISLPFILLILL